MKWEGTGEVQRGDGCRESGSVGVKGWRYGEIEIAEGERYDGRDEERENLKKA